MAVLVEITQGLFTAYWYVLLASAIIGFLPDIRQTNLGQTLARITDPYLNLFRRIIRPLPIGPVMLDVSWIVGVGVFMVVRTLVFSLLSSLLGMLT
ncbi:YggT family protein [Alicyclobacillus fodiniaquatilis]|uniref:YggT family protein n=1 Tax=Alicyclobacillus fodiniaquatilis TaxID=1661150 RepID=A0ABW4JN25_9BACL